jgi:hypothetical protein
MDSVLGVGQKIFRRISAAQFMLCFSQISSRVLHRKPEIQEVFSPLYNTVIPQFLAQLLNRLVLGFVVRVRVKV